MATIEQCRQSLEEFASSLGRSEAERPGAGTDLDRTFSYHVRDLDVTFSGRLTGGRLVGLDTAPAPKAQIRLASTSDDLLALTSGELDAASAWSSGRLSVQAGVLDLLKLKSML